MNDFATRTNVAALAARFGTDQGAQDDAILDAQSLAGQADAKADAAQEEADRAKLAAGITPQRFGDGAGGWQIAINAAISALHAQGGGKLVIPALSAPYEITAPIVIKSHVHVDFGKAKITLANGANCDMIQTDGFYGLTGTNNYAADGSPRNFRLTGGIFDGNRANQAPADPDACNGLSIYGYGFTIEDVEVRNVRGNGYRGEWGQFGGEAVGSAMESKVANCRFDTSGRRGFWHKGPHDAHFDHIVVIDASQEADDTYDAIVSEGYGGGRWYNPHAWHRSGSVNRARWAGNFVCGGNEILGGHLEGGRRQYRTLGANMTLGIHCYAPRSDNAQIEISGERNTFHGRFSNSTQNPRPTVLALGATATCGMSDINLTAVVGASGPSNPLVQIAASVGNNSIRIRSTGADAANVFTGSFDDFDDVTITQEFSARINYRRLPFIASGAASRPSPAAPGQYHFDTGLGKPIWRNGANTAWVDATGTTV